MAGGRGTRLYPLTEDMPKALLPVANRPLLLYQLDVLERSGFTGAVWIARSKARVCAHVQPACRGHCGHPRVRRARAERLAGRPVPLRGCHQQGHVPSRDGGAQAYDAPAGTPVAPDARHRSTLCPSTRTRSVRPRRCVVSAIACVATLSSCPVTSCRTYRFTCALDRARASCVHAVRRRQPR